MFIVNCHWNCDNMKQTKKQTMQNLRDLAMFSNAKYLTFKWNSQSLKFLLKYLDFDCKN